ncbi:probable asparagine synthetase [glutamine-hydrolyzing] [Drosophila grimshawi]|uniref:Asparagine synthetase [glutamine-hydrolyzing] n=1 Tax=Drosophila grimshawi TaxID=7222 RepID=B4J146_DROGR|nr:probable asparagine synthetase [glutamine-hydrolyzing] [Drosophila grimshawi]EDV96901.1 GH14963 [Drosophila grimshawi]
MCGILAIFSADGQPIGTQSFEGSEHSLRELAYRQSGKQRHRGPDDTGILVIEEQGVALVHERLAVIGVATGHQPLQSRDGNIALITNGEIYNYLELTQKIVKRLPGYQPKSDCNVIIELYEEHGNKLLEHITGMFSFVLYDRRRRQLLVARDPFGIIPLYMGKDAAGNLWFASEMKCLVNVCDQLQVFPPGHMAMGTVKQLPSPVRYYQPSWRQLIPTAEVNLKHLRQQLELAVRSHLQCDVPFGALLSGGVDSSLIAAIAARIMRERDPSYKLRTFSVGMSGSPDFVHARLVAKHIGSEHTEITFDVDDCLDGVRDLIYHLETYDVATVRCSLPMFYLARHVKSTGIKMILSGEGADEIFGGYLYFHKAPNYEEFHQEMITRCEQLHVSDILRANKVTMSKGLELRVPFLDTALVDHVMGIRPQDKMAGALNEFTGDRKWRMEKFVLRQAFTGDYLPDAVLWRQKEQFSDGVGYALIDALPNFAARHVSDAQLLEAKQRFPINPPKTKEAFYYRCIFEEQFPGESAANTVEKWAPRLDWGCPEDPSGRAQAAHDNGYGKCTIDY